MRLNDYQRKSLREAVREFLPDARVLLYGSRTDDAKRGGDIDILVLTEQDIPLKLRLAIESRMWQKIGEQKIDVLFEKPSALSTFGELVFPEAIPI